MKQRLRTKFMQYDRYGNLYCYKCKLYQSPKSFDKVGHKNCWFRGNRDRRCKNCKKEQRLKRNIANRGDGSLYRVLLERFHGAKDRARIKGLVIDFDVKYLEELWGRQNGLCAISGVEMTHIIFSGRIPTNVSIDRIDSKIGYNKNNIQLVCMAINQMKSDLSNEELLFFCNAVVRRKK